MPKARELILSDDEVEQLMAISQREDITNTVRARIKVLLAADRAHGEHYSHTQAAIVAGVHRKTVSTIVRQYQEKGIESMMLDKRSAEYWRQKKMDQDKPSS